MKTKILIGLLLITSTALAVNVTINAGECYTTDNTTVCSPAVDVNTTTIYQSCIADTKAYFNPQPINDNINAVGGNVTVIKVQEENLQANLSTLFDIIKGANISYAQSYASCSVDLNTSKTSNDLCHTTLGNISTGYDDLLKRITLCEPKAAQLDATQQQLTQSDNDKWLWLAAGLIGGAVLWTQWQEHQKPHGRQMLADNSPKEF